MVLVLQKNSCLLQKTKPVGVNSASIGKTTRLVVPTCDLFHPEHLQFLFVWFVAYMSCFPINKAYCSLLPCIMTLWLVGVRVIMCDQERIMCLCGGAEEYGHDDCNILASLPRERNFMTYYIAFACTKFHSEPH